MTMDQFTQLLLNEAKNAGIEAAEIYLASSDSFRAMCQQGQINNYTVNSTQGLSLRGIYQGKMGYAATEAFDESAVAQLVEAVKESAELTEDEDEQEIYKGDASYPQVENYQPALDLVDENRKKVGILTMEDLLEELVGDIQDESDAGEGVELL